MYDEFLTESDVLAYFVYPSLQLPYVLSDSTFVSYYLPVNKRKRLSYPLACRYNDTLGYPV